MIRTFPYNRVRKRIHEQRRKDLQDRIRIIQMARTFETAGERQKREALAHLRSQDWR